MGLATSKIPRSVAALALVLAAFSSASAQSNPTYVDAKSNIFGYGVGTPQPGGYGGGVVAPSFVLTPGATSVTFFSSGSAGWDGPGSSTNGPDGGTFSSNTKIPAVGPISGFSAPLSGDLVGLFIPSGDFSGLSAPASLSYPSLASLGQASYAPGLRQLFYIGDGLTGTGTGTTQIFAIPAGASKLVLGIADAVGFNASAGAYDDNFGGFNVNYNIIPTPEPSALAVLGLGAVAVAVLRRRKRA